MNRNSSCVSTASSLASSRSSRRSRPNYEWTIHSRASSCNWTYQRNFVYKRLLFPFDTAYFSDYHTRRSRVLILRTLWIPRSAQMPRTTRACHVTTLHSVSITAYCECVLAIYRLFFSLRCGYASLVRVWCLGYGNMGWTKCKG